MRNALLVLFAIAFASAASATVPISIINLDAPGVGFNDPTPAAPVGGNAGSTLGAQRMIVFQAAAAKWGGTLTSVVPIRIQAQWTSSTCTATTGLLASTRSLEVFEGFNGAPKQRHWYPKSLADEITGIDQDSTMADMEVSVNADIGQADCLTGLSFYLGLDHNAGTSINLLTVLTHEFAHGLGFATFTNASTGVECCSTEVLPSAYDDFLLDTQTGKSWTAMTNDERVASAINNQKVVWTGAAAVAAVPGVLKLGAPVVNITAPASVAGPYEFGTATFGAPLASPGVTGQVVQVIDSADNVGLACARLTADNAAAVAGNIALIDRGTCAFVTKAENAQAAGAIGVMVVDNVTESTPVEMQGTDATITIPVVSLLQTDGNTLKAQLAALPAGETMIAFLGLDLTRRAGADSANRPLMFTPSTYEGGSTISHWDTSATPDQLMEPFIEADESPDVVPPHDLTVPLLVDMGWSYSPAPTSNYEGLWWAAPAGVESGWGINFAHQGDTIFATWFTYSPSGKGMWLVMSAPKISAGVYAGSLYTTTGPPFNAVPFNPNLVQGTLVGSGTILFADGNDATFAYTVNGIGQSKAITREVFGPPPTCATATGSLAAATNYQDLWWAAPAGVESGWGINLTHQGNTIFATWFTYDLDGSQMWLVVSATKQASGAFTGALYRTTGPAFNAQPFNPADVVGTLVGAATFTFADGNDATFAYTVNGVSQSKKITREVFAAPGTVCVAN